MSLLNNVVQPENLDKEKDSLGGFSVLETDAYMAEVTLAYLKKAASGALGTVFTFRTEDGREITQTEWFQSGDAKGNKTTFTDQQTKEEMPLPGFTFCNNVCLLTAKKGLLALAGETEQKTVQIYDAKEGKPMPKDVEVLTPLLGKKILLGIEHQIVNKQQKTDSGYQNTNEEREINVISVLCHAESRKTPAEIRNKMEQAEFIDLWLEKNKGNVINKFKSVANAPQSGNPTQSNAKSEAAQDSVFGEEG